MAVSFSCLGVQEGLSKIGRGCFEGGRCSSLNKRRRDRARHQMTADADDDDDDGPHNQMADGEHEPCSWQCTSRNTLSASYSSQSGPRLTRRPEPYLLCSQRKNKEPEASAARCNAMRRLMGRTSLQVPALGRRISSARRFFFGWVAGFNVNDPWTHRTGWEKPRQSRSSPAAGARPDLGFAPFGIALSTAVPSHSALCRTRLG